MVLIKKLKLRFNIYLIITKAFLSYFYFNLLINNKYF